MSNFHIPVMPKEVIKFLNVQKNSWYIDCNLGGGGHTELILQKGGKALGIDLDPDSISHVIKKYNSSNLHYSNDRYINVTENLTVVQDNFANLESIIRRLQIKPVMGILFDLGVSSYQLKTAKRGFSFNLDAPLDMRMDPIHQTVTAADLINGLHEGELSELFWKLGEENFSKVIARKIVESRKTRKIESTKELTDLIARVKRNSPVDKTNAATRVFQSLRIAVNDELNSLKQALPQALDILKPGGRLVVISFHSLEDRIVKNYFKDWENTGLINSLTKKPIEPTEEEINLNPRSRSGKLRAISKN